MADDPRVESLLEQLLNSRGDAEEICRDCPELLPQVRAEWQRVREIQTELGVLFPDSAGPNDTMPGAASVSQFPKIADHQVLEVLGHGGMGIVYKAWHLRLHRPVAVKMLLAGPFARPQELERFVREAQAAAGLNHPNIVQIYEVGNAEGRPYFTMEFVEGGSLAQKLAGVPQPVRQAAAVTATLAETVQVAHQHGIIHRHLKPANVLLTGEDIPKIADFGLARRIEEEGGPTQTGIPLGTPSYMAPEQAGGKTSAVGPAVDIYALGAILYELLTGRPPFRGESGAETVQQVLCREPVPPSRLNPRVPRDLETICLKCLRKEPERRYASAAALSNDLTCFLEGRPIQARPLSPVARLGRWCRRQPASAVLLATALASVGLAIGGGLWMERLRAERRAETARQEERQWQAVKAAVEKAAILGQQGRWPEALAALAGAESLLDSSTPEDLRDRLRQARADAEMVAQLEEIRLRLSDSRASQETASASPENVYADTFRNYGIPLQVLDPGEAAARIRISSIRPTLLEFLHDWFFRGSVETRARLRGVLDRADDDDWRRAFRKSLVEKNAEKLIALAGEVSAPDQPPVVLSCLGAALVGDEYKNKALVLLRQAQQRHPGDFWINYLLGQYCSKERPQEAIGYFRVAVAIRPANDRVHLMLASALLDTGDREGAIAAVRESIDRNPNDKRAKELANALTPKRGMEEVRAAWETRLLKPNPKDHKSWHGYPQLCLYVGNVEAYRVARKAMLEHFGDVTNDWVIAERTSMACLLLPDSGDELRRAVRLADVAVAVAEKSSEPGNAYVKFVKGFALYREGRFAEALPFLQQSAYKLLDRTGPRMVLAMAQFRSGSAVEARKTLAEAVRTYNWNEPNPKSRPDYISIWVSHVLRREAEAMILPHLAEFLEGKYQPVDNDERLSLLGICQSRGLARASAQLYADAFEANHALAEELNADCLRRATEGKKSISGDRLDAFNAACRYLAARCAALAGCGLGKDGADLSALEQTHWRKQARKWLEDDLAMWTRTLDSDSPRARGLTIELLTHWQSAPELVGLREPHALDELSAEERTECLALWRNVRNVLQGAAARQQVRRATIPDPKSPATQGATVGRLGGGC